MQIQKCLFQYNVDIVSISEMNKSFTNNIWQILIPMFSHLPELYYNVPRCPPQEEK
jgi:hypothetical protein